MNRGNIFAELKRRNVYKVGVAYIVAGWALLTAALDRRSLWLGSLGLLAVSLGGWRLPRESHRSSRSSTFRTGSFA